MRIAQIAHIRIVTLWSHVCLDNMTAQVALHCSPDKPYPFHQTIPLLYCVLGAQGSGASAKILPLLQSCCQALTPDQLKVRYSFMYLLIG